MKYYSKKTSYVFMILAFIAMMLFGCERGGNPIIPTNENDSKFQVPKIKTADDMETDFYTLNIEIWNDGVYVVGKTITFYEVEQFYTDEFTIGSQFVDKMENIKIKYGISWNSQVRASAYWGINSGWWEELPIKQNTSEDLSFKTSTWLGNGVYVYTIAILEI